jgi:hypothetical protein
MVQQMVRWVLDPMQTPHCGRPTLQQGCCSHWRRRTLEMVELDL